MSERSSNRPARRAILRWALRLLRREWRQHVLVVVLLTVTVAGALFGATAAYNLAPSHDGRFGLANHRFDVIVDDRQQLDEFVADADAWFGEVDVITYRHVPVAGSREDVEIRFQDPVGPFGAGMLALLDGRYPATSGELALTDGTARLLDAFIGDSIELEDQQATVVGIVENPDKLSDEFALATPSPTESLDAATILLRTDEDRARDFRSHAEPASWGIEARGQGEKTLAAIGVLVAATVAMLLVSLVTAAAFVVIARRRQRQLGLLAAAGATERQVRLVMIAGGAAAGLIAAVAGAVLA